MIEIYDVIVIGSKFCWSCCSENNRLMIERSENVGEKVISGLAIPIYGFLFGPAFIRDGNPLFERPTDGIINYIITDIDNGKIEIDDTLRVPRLSFGYNSSWEAIVCSDAVRR